MIMSPIALQALSIPVLLFFAGTSLPQVVPFTRQHLLCAVASGPEGLAADAERR